VLGVDHLMMGVADFRAAAARWESEHGLRAIEGLRFADAPGFGNWAVPLGETWIELVGITDRDAADGDPRAQLFSAVVAGGDRLLGWALAPADLDAVAERLRLPISRQHATHLATGDRLTWRQVGFDETRMRHYLPFFVGWDHDAHADNQRLTDELGNASAKQADVTIELTGDPESLERWLGDLQAPVSITEGPPGITAWISTDRGPLTVR
jgi:hypothetical protein